MNRTQEVFMRTSGITAALIANPTASDLWKDITTHGSVESRRSISAPMILQSVAGWS